MKKISSLVQFVIVLIVLLVASCSPLSKNEALQLVKDHYAKEATVAGGNRELLKKATILKFDDSNKDTIKATVKIEATFSPNQVPDAASPSDYVDTLYWGFYKKEGKWESTYNGTPW